MNYTVVGDSTLQELPQYLVGTVIPNAFIPPLEALQRIAVSKTVVVTTNGRKISYTTNSCSIVMVDGMANEIVSLFAMQHRFFAVCKEYKIVSNDRFLTVEKSDKARVGIWQLQDLSYPVIFYRSSQNRYILLNNMYC